jgi:hypothetical protein
MRMLATLPSSPPRTRTRVKKISMSAVTLPINGSVHQLIRSLPFSTHHDVALILF